MFLFWSSHRHEAVLRQPAARPLGFMSPSAYTTHASGTLQAVCNGLIVPPRPHLSGDTSQTSTFHGAVAHSSGRRSINGFTTFDQSHRPQMVISRFLCLPNSDSEADQSNEALSLTMYIFRFVRDGAASQVLQASPCFSLTMPFLIDFACSGRRQCGVSSCFYTP